MKDLPRLIFKTSGFILLFLFSGILGYKHILPYHTLEQDLTGTAETIAQFILKKPNTVLKRKYDREGATIVEGKIPYDGLTALQGWFSDGLSVKLIDLQGKLVHEWSIDFFKIWPNPNPEQFEKADQIPHTKYAFHSQGMYLYPDGSLLANVGSIALIKMDKCGKVLWTSNHFNHHAVTVDNQGFIWTPAHRKLQDIPDDLFYYYFKQNSLSNNEKSSYENLILKMNPDGKVVQTISVLRKVIEAGFEDRIYDALLINATDPLHVNDIEIVTAALAKKLESRGVKEGDLLVSIRQLHTLVIMNRESGDILWHQTGPWVRQHDPDIDEDGNITVYNNRSVLLKKSGKEEPYSNILKFYPDDEHVEDFYPTDGKGFDKHQNFFSDIMGIHQGLPNGDMLLTETRTGRVFEVDSKGNLVWEYIENYHKDYASLIESANRYDKDYFTVKDWSCH